MLEVIGEKCKHTNEQEVNYTAYCDQLTFSNPVHLTAKGPKLILVSLINVFNICTILHRRQTQSYIHNGRNVNKIAP